MRERGKEGIMLVEGAGTKEMMGRETQNIGWTNRRGGKRMT